MKFTNNHNLPQSVFEAITKDSYTGKKNDLNVISATTLIQPPKIRMLNIRHDDEIQEDAIDNVWRLLGSSVHAVVQNVNDDDKFLEERINIEFEGKVVSLQPDVINQKEHTIDDYKVTSAWSLTYEPTGKKEWKEQLNVYAWGVRRTGFEVKKLRIIAILRDWSEKNVDGGNYPKSPVVVIELPLWTFEEQEAFVKQRIELHRSFESALDDEIIHCSAEERWAKEDKWAVYKNGNKRADRVLDTKQDAEHYAESMIAEGKHPTIEHRPGEDVRCDRYCSVNKFCHYYQQKKK